MSLYMDASRPVSERVSLLMQQMTLEEKVAQLGSHWVYELLDGVTFSEAKARPLLMGGIGHITRTGGASNVTPRESADLNNSIQKFLIENTRLGIPAVIHEECCSGYMARGATVFPQAIGVASAWDPELVEAMTNVIRLQMRAVGAHHALAPVLDVARDARWGRVEETFGEDPYLVARLGVAYIKGLQGADLGEGIVATGKHFVGYSMSEGGMNWAPPHLMRRELNEVYLLPFEAAVREAGMASIMNGYHEIDGVPCGSSRELLTEILRENWGFTGTVVSDYFAVSQLYEYHHIAGDNEEAARLALDAGVDVELPGTDSFGEPLLESVRQGRTPLTLIDTALERILAQKFTLGLFEKPYVESGVVTLDTLDERQLARQIAQKSLVLLKNDGDMLPLPKDLKSIAVIGPNADNVRNLFGDYAYPAHIETLLEAKRMGNFFGTPMPENIESVADFIEAVSVLDAVRAMVGDVAQVYYAQGCDVLSERTDGFAEAVEAARRAEVAIVVVGDKAGLTDDCTSGEGRDRAVLDLPGVQGDLVRAVYETGTPIVLVLVNGRPVTLNWIASDVPAILEAWFPSEEGANAIADVLFGDVNPGGKLPMTFPRTVGQVPTFYGHRASGGRSHWKGEYVDTSNLPQYPFGYGLSYTRFAFTNLRTDRVEARPGESMTVHVDVQNIGRRAGDEVVQFYSHQLTPYVTRPVRELRGFARITLEPGQTKTVSFEMDVNQLGYYDRDYRYVVAPGIVELFVGNSSQNTPLQTAVEIIGNITEIGEANKAFFSTVVTQ